MNYISLATPHLGTKRSAQYTSARIFNSLQSTVLTRVGPQFTVSDNYMDGLPLMVVLSEPKYHFMKALALFKQRVAFANIENDRSVRYTTASISDTNPYSRFEARAINPEFPSIVTYDKEVSKIKPGWTFSSLGSTAMKFVLLPVLIPVWLTIASIGLTVVAAKSTYRQSTLAIENGWIKADNNQTGQSAEAKEEDDIEDHLEDVSKEETTLNKSKDQVRIRMIKNLNALGWKKVDVLIDKFNAHAAIVRRKPYTTGSHVDVLLYLTEKVFLL